MLLSSVRRFFKKSILIRASTRLGLTGAILLGANYSLDHAIAKGDTRTLSFHHLHTDENITITFKRNGRYDEAALKKLDWFMRDWRKQEAIHMDPQLFDILWEAYQESGAIQPIQVVCGYRSPATNAMLHARSSGVAQFSQHMLGHAMDFFIPGVPLEKIREVGLRLQRGGVGFYPTSGSPFVHLDTGTVRYWPRMTYAQLSKVFPNGRTVHVAADGRTLPGYAQALADLERRGKTPNANSLVAARATGVITASQEQQAETVVQANARGPKHTLLASLFDLAKSKNTNIDEREDEKAAPPSGAKQAHIAGPKPAPRETTKRIATEHVTPLPTSRPPIAVASTRPKHLQQPIATASIGNDTFNNRGAWAIANDKGADRVALSTAYPPFAIAAAEPSTIGSPGQALSYAATATPDLINPVRSTGDSAPRLTQEAWILQADGAMTVAAKPPLAPAMGVGGPLADNPWIRAAILTPSVSHFMTATLMGHVDLRMLRPLLDKPSQSVMMTFSTDPALNLITADRFTGPAVVFLATTSFVEQKTASLQ